MSIWDDPAMRAGGDFVKFENSGDKIAGVVEGVTRGQDMNGGPCPQLFIRDDSTGESRTLTASQAQLKTKLSEARPEEGDHVDITFVRSEKRDGGKTLKHFDVKVTRAADRPQAPAGDLV